jgi:hypothetical protein
VENQFGERHSSNAAVLLLMDYAHLERAGRVTQTLTPRPLEMRKVINDRIASK